MHPYKYLNNEKSTYTVAAANRRIGIITGDGIMYTINFASGPGGALVAGLGVYIDINVAKGPNVYGKDFFMFNIVGDKGVIPVGYNLKEYQINDNCSKNGKNDACAAKIMRDGWQMKNDYPW